MSTMPQLWLDGLYPNWDRLLMTVIAACVDQDGSVWMGSDCISLHRDNEIKESTRSKIFRLGEMVIAASGGTRAGQIVEHMITPGAIPADCKSLGWLVTEFVPVLRKAMQEHGGEYHKDGVNLSDARLLVGLRGGIYEIDIGYGVIAHKGRIAAVGCADQEAVAGMFIALKVKPDLHARRVVELGLEAAAEFNINIRPPFEIVCDLEESVAGLRAVK